MPSIPLLDTHGISVDLLIQLVEKADSLDDHGVDLIGRELELVPGKRMGQTELHSTEIGTTNATGLVIAGLHELVHVAADATEKLRGLGVVNDAARKLVLDARGQSLVSDGEAFPALLLQLLLEEGFQGLVHLTLDASRGSRNGIGGVRKGLERDEVEHRLGFVLIGEKFVIHVIGIGLFKLLLVGYLFCNRGGSDGVFKER